MTLTFSRPVPTRAPQPVIAADQLVLRPLRKADADLLGAYVADRRVAEGTRSIPHPLPAGAAQAFIDEALIDGRDEDVWAIDGTPGGSASLLGVVSLKALDRSQSQIGYWVAPAFWHGGIASAAVRALLDANPHANCTVFAEVFQDNPGSAKVLTNCGFEYLGDAESWSVARNALVPTWTYLRKMG